MLKNLRIQINGGTIAEIPPISIMEEMPHWLTFVSVLYNTFERPKPLSLDNPGYFFPCKTDGSIEPMYYWFNTLVHDTIIRYDNDKSDVGTQVYYVQFPLGRYIEQHFGLPVRWLTWGIYMDIEVLFHNQDAILDYCYSLPSYYASTNSGTQAAPKISLGMECWLFYIMINDQNAEIFHELNDLVISLYL